MRQPTSTAATAKVTISVPADLYERWVAYADAHRCTRSAVAAAAIAQYLYDEESRALLKELKAAYGDEPPDDQERARSRRRIERIGALLRAEEDEPW